MWFLFGATPGVDFCSRYFGAINGQQNDEQNLRWNAYTTNIYLHQSKICSH